MEPKGIDILGLCWAFSGAAHMQMRLLRLARTCPPRPLDFLRDLRHRPQHCWQPSCSTAMRAFLGKTRASFSRPGFSHVNSAKHPARSETYTRYLAMTLPPLTISQGEVAIAETTGSHTRPGADWDGRGMAWTQKRTAVDLHGCPIL